MAERIPSSVDRYLRTSWAGISVERWYPPETD
jgi:hypothetical protein